MPQGCETACEFSVTLGASLLLLVGLLRRGCSAAVGGAESSWGVWSACEVPVERGGGLTAILWAGAEECGKWEAM